ncbi:MAG: hypothetical protein RLZZ196_690 [Bacteroidota bacterium]|jgi:hypothetical protein
MNERIEQLLYQSGLTAQGCWDELDDYAQQGIEKFALLVVRECAEQVKDFYQEDRFNCFNAAERIKDHFGFEE